MAILRRNFICYFVLYGCILEISLQKRSDFYLSNYQLYTNDKYVNESQLKEKCEINTKEQPCKYTPYFSFFLVKEMKNPWLTVKGVHVNNNDSFVEQTFNLCTFDRMPMTNIFIALFYELFRKNINFEMKCPFKQGEYTVKNWKNDYSLASNLIQPNNPDRFSLICKQKVGKKYEDVYRYSFDVESVWV